MKTVYNYIHDINILINPKYNIEMLNKSYSIIYKDTTAIFIIDNSYNLYDFGNSLKRYYVKLNEKKDADNIDLCIIYDKIESFVCRKTKIKNFLDDISN